MRFICINIPSAASVNLFDVIIQVFPFFFIYLTVMNCISAQVDVGRTFRIPFVLHIILLFVSYSPTVFNTFFCQYNIVVVKKLVLLWHSPKDSDR